MSLYIRAWRLTLAQSLAIFRLLAFNTLMPLGYIKALGVEGKFKWSRTLKFVKVQDITILSQMKYHFENVEKSFTTYPVR